MNYRLLATFIISQLFEFSLFYLLASFLSDYIGYATLNIFIGFVGLDIILTVLVFHKAISIFIENLFIKLDDT